MKDGFFYSVAFHLCLFGVLLFFAPMAEIRELTKKKPPVKITFASKGSAQKNLVSAKPSVKKQIPPVRPTLSKPAVTPVAETPTKAPAVKTQPVKKVQPAKTVAPSVKKPAETVKKAPTPVKKTAPAPVKKTVTAKKPVPVKKSAPKPSQKNVTSQKVVKKPVSKPLPVKPKPVDFGMSVADRVKNAWSDTVSSPTAEVKPPDPTLLAKATTDSSVKLPELPSFNLPSLDVAIPQVQPVEDIFTLPGMKTGGAVSSKDSWYLSAVKERLDSFWIRPSRIVGDKDECVLAFRILRSGEVRESRISTPSGNDVFDASVLTSLKRAGSFQPLPKDVGAENGETFFLTFILQR